MPLLPLWAVVACCRVNFTLLYIIFYIPPSSPENIKYRNAAGNVKVTCMIRHVSFSLNNSKEHGGD